MKIQISDRCRDLLESIGGFLIQERGQVDVKVIGMGFNISVVHAYICDFLIQGQRNDDHLLVIGRYQRIIMARSLHLIVFVHSYVLEDHLMAGHINNGTYPCIEMRNTWDHYAELAIANEQHSSSGT